MRYCFLLGHCLFLFFYCFAIFFLLFLLLVIFQLFRTLYLIIIITLHSTSSFFSQPLIAVVIQINTTCLTHNRCQPKCVSIRLFTALGIEANWQFSYNKWEENRRKKTPYDFTQTQKNDIIIIRMTKEKQKLFIKETGNFKATHWNDVGRK